MARNTFVTPEPVILDGFQAVMQPGKFGYSMKAIVNHDMILQLEEDRIECLKWAESKLSNPKRSTLKVEPWEEIENDLGNYIVKFSWKEDTRPPIVDTEGTLIEDNLTPIYNGSTVKLAFTQKPYVLKDKVTYGTSLKIQGIQVVSVSGSAGVDVGDMSSEDVAALFPNMKGYKVDEPNVKEVESGDDF